MKNWSQLDHSPISCPFGYCFQVCLALAPWRLGNPVGSWPKTGASKGRLGQAIGWCFLMFTYISIHILYMLDHFLCQQSSTAFNMCWDHLRSGAPRCGPSVCTNGTPCRCSTNDGTTYLASGTTMEPRLHMCSTVDMWLLWLFWFRKHLRWNKEWSIQQIGSEDDLPGGMAPWQGCPVQQGPPTYMVMGDGMAGGNAKFLHVMIF